MPISERLAVWGAVWGAVLGFPPQTCAAACSWGLSPTTWWISFTSVHPLSDCHFSLSYLGDAFLGNVPKQLLKFPMKVKTRNIQARIGSELVTIRDSHHEISQDLQTKRELSKWAGNQDPATPWRRGLSGDLQWSDPADRTLQITSFLNHLPTTLEIRIKSPDWSSW